MASSRRCSTVQLQGRQPTILRGQTAFLLGLCPLQAGPPELGDVLHVTLVLFLLLDCCAREGGVGREEDLRLEWDNTALMGSNKDGSINNDRQSIFFQDSLGFAPK